MSADNAIVIVRFSDGQCKVRHMQNTEELYYYPVDNVFQDGLFTPTVYKLFKDCFLYKNYDVAELAAQSLYDEYDFVEYGIITAECNYKWKDISFFMGSK